MEEAKETRMEDNEERAKGARGGQLWVQADKPGSPPLPLPAACPPARGDRGRGGGTFTGPHCSEMIKNQ